MEAFALPLFKIEPLPWRAPDAGEFDALLLTSANAVRQAGAELDALRSLPAHAVGQATADAARAAGLCVVSCGTAGITELLAESPPGTRLLHLCGKHRRAPAVAEQRITTLPVYRAAEIPRPENMDRLSGAVALVHSPRAGARLAALTSDKATIGVAAISAAAAEACGGGWEQVAWAEQPRDDVLLSLGARLCEQLPPK